MSSEEMIKAARWMNEAAETMKEAANNFNETSHRLISTMQELIQVMSTPQLIQETRKLRPGECFFCGEEHGGLPCPKLIPTAGGTTDD